MKLGRTIVVTIAVLLIGPSLCAQDKTYDVVIVGAGTGGVAAALQASRLGAKVALLEEIDWIGGQMTAAAVSTMDEGGTITQRSGIYGEFLQKMTEYYARNGKSIHTCYYTLLSHCFEPSAAQKVLYSMLDETRAQHHVLDVYLRTRVVRVLADGDTVTGVVTASGSTIRSKVLIDATEFGDVLPLTPALYRLGNSTSDHIDSRACVQSITYVAVIKRYLGGVPAELNMKSPPPGYDDALRNKLQRVLQATGNSTSKVPPVNLAMHNVYRGLPDSSGRGSYDVSTPDKITRSELNWFNDYPFGVKDFDAPERKKRVCEAKLKTLQVLYYIQHGIGATDWSVANDEGFATDYNASNSCSNIPREFKTIEQNLPPLPYVRESRRIVGVDTLTAGEIRREGDPSRAVQNAPTSIAVGDYADDLHGCSAENNLEASLEHESDRPPGFRGGPFQVPIGSLIPKHTDGLLAAEKNISQSRTANGATRLQPITMLTGQASGALAAIAVQENVQPRMVRAELVQKALLEAGSVLALETVTDVEEGSELWRAIEFVEAKGWMTPKDGKFFPEKELNRGEAAELLAAAYGVAKPFNEFRPSVVTTATYADVPLWDRYSVPVERLSAMKVVEPCPKQSQHFCPLQAISQKSFLRMVEALSRHQGFGSMNVALGIPEKATMSRGDAALILYRSMTTANDRPLHTTARSQQEVPR